MTNTIALESLLFYGNILNNTFFKGYSKKFETVNKMFISLVQICTFCRGSKQNANIFSEICSKENPFPKTLRCKLKAAIHHSCAYHVSTTTCTIINWNYTRHFPPRTVYFRRIKPIEATVKEKVFKAKLFLLISIVQAAL